MGVKRADQRLARRGGIVELLHAPALLFRGVTAARRGLYDRGWLPSARLDVPVISVGNLSAGGTGKTPAVIDLAQRLCALGRRPGLLSRGYKATPDGAGGNDEAALLAECLPDVPHVADPDRVRGGWALIKQGVDVVILDDGFQHRRLSRDIDVVLIDALRPWGLAAANGAPVCALLPRGLLRESRVSLRRADLLVLTRGDRISKAQRIELAQQLAHFAPGVPLCVASHQPVAVRTPNGDCLDPSALSGRTVDLASGIGNPEGFEASIRGLGAEIGTHRRFPDHHAFALGDLDGLGERNEQDKQSGERWTVVTAKDAVKLRDANVHVLEIEFAYLEGEAILQAQLESLRLARHVERLNALHEGLHG